MSIKSFRGLMSPSWKQVNYGNVTISTAQVALPGWYESLTANAVHGTQQFSSNGTFVVPLGVTQILVAITGGGGGGGLFLSGGAGNITAGGNSGTTVVSVLSVSDGQSFAISLGAGGAGAPAGSTAAGSAGGSSYFGSLITAIGGSGGVANNAGPPATQGNSTYPTGSLEFWSFGQASSDDASGGVAASVMGGNSFFALGGNSNASNGTNGSGGLGWSVGPNDTTPAGNGGDGFCQIWW